MTEEIVERQWRGYVIAQHRDGTIYGRYSFTDKNRAESYANVLRASYQLRGSKNVLVSVNEK